MFEDNSIAVLSRRALIGVVFTSGNFEGQHDTAVKVDSGGISCRARGDEECLLILNSYMYKSYECLALYFAEIIGCKRERVLSNLTVVTASTLPLITLAV